MLVHSVYFWLKDGISRADRAALRAGLETLRGVKTVQQMFIGTPAATKERGVIDKSYDFALTVLFQDVAAQDAYQTDPLHVAFLEKFAPLWREVIVYDAE